MQVTRTGDPELTSRLGHPHKLGGLLTVDDGPLGPPQPSEAATESAICSDGQPHNGAPERRIARTAAGDLNAGSERT
jgi:hypothetical protein